MGNGAMRSGKMYMGTWRVLGVCSKKQSNRACGTRRDRVEMICTCKAQIWHQEFHVVLAQSQRPC